MRTHSLPLIVSLIVTFVASHSDSSIATDAANSPPPPLQVDWSQPAVGCVEELVPHLPDRPCLDLTTVQNPLREWPALPVDELEYWKTTKRPVNYCRAIEVERREQAQPGSQDPGQLQLAWMWRRAVEGSDRKVELVYQASQANRVPAQILAGAFYQESLFSNLGIAEDGGNYSCGIGQVNILEWCHWANSLSASEQAKLNWPAPACSKLSLKLLKPFYGRALRNLGTEPMYMLSSNHFAGIRYQDVRSDLPGASEAERKRVFKSVMSFVANCTKAENGIPAKALELRRVFDQYVPEGLKQREIYRTNESYARQCRESDKSGYYPLHTGWLLAVGIFNAGHVAVDALAHYNRWSLADLNNSDTFKVTDPSSLIEAFYWSGAYNPKDDRLHFSRLNGKATSWTYFKACVLQRHISRIVQHTTLPGVSSLVKSLEGAEGCQKSEFDPETGRLVKTSVPLERQVASGYR